MDILLLLRRPYNVLPSPSPPPATNERAKTSEGGRTKCKSSRREENNREILFVAKLHNSPLLHFKYRPSFPPPATLLCKKKKGGKAMSKLIKSARRRNPESAHARLYSGQRTRQGKKRERKLIRKSGAFAAEWWGRS